MVVLKFFRDGHEEEPPPGWLPQHGEPAACSALCVGCMGTAGSDFPEMHPLWEVDQTQEDCLSLL